METALLIIVGEISRAARETSDECRKVDRPHDLLDGLLEGTPLHPAFGNSVKAADKILHLNNVANAIARFRSVTKEDGEWRILDA